MSVKQLDIGLYKKISEEWAYGSDIILPLLIDRRFTSNELIDLEIKLDMFGSIYSEHGGMPVREFCNLLRTNDRVSNNSTIN